MKDIDVSGINHRISEFLTRHQSSLYKIATRSTDVFEAFCFTVFVRHYEIVGYRVEPKNLRDGKFRFRHSTRGYPWNFSYFVVFADESANQDVVLFEIRHNQKVSSPWVLKEETDPPVFAVDVAVIRPNNLPDLKPGQKRKAERYWVESEHLITFGEAKKLTAYPMLLAQFLGIVHEIKPEFLKPEGHETLSLILEQRHPPPVLLTANHLSWGTRKVLQSYEERGILVRVVDNVTGSSEETLLCKMRGEEPQASKEAEIPF